MTARSMCNVLFRNWPWAVFTCHEKARSNVLVRFQILQLSMRKRNFETRCCQIRVELRINTEMLSFVLLI